MRVDFGVFAEKNLLHGGMWFLQGNFEILRCFWMVNRGEVVVICVANVVF